MRFTILTATYNRGACLEHAYRSLCAQTFRDFEWLIVDDGSTDGTGEIVTSWKSFFPIRYLWKPNGGKHTAVNLGAVEAAGDLIVILDSDDRCVPETLARFDERWKQIPDPERFGGLVALCYCQDGTQILGDPFPSDVVDVFSLRESLLLVPLVGKVDRFGMVRTEVLRKFPYPVFEDEHDILEGVVWNRILRKYAFRYFNEPLKIAGYAPGGLSDGRDRRIGNPKGAVIFHAELALSDVPVRLRLKSALNTARFAIHAVLRKMGRTMQGVRR